jgi:hypothetical protein
MAATPLSMPTANAAAWSPRAITMKHSLEASHQRRSRTAAIIVAVHLMFGTVSFSLLEGWSLRDALYFSVQTLSTVGYGDLVPSHPASKLLCCVYILIGVSLISASLGAVLGRMQAAGEARMRSAIESPTTSEPLSAADKGTPSTSRHNQGSSRHSQGSSRHSQGSSRHSQGSSRHSQGSSRHSQGSSRHGLDRPAPPPSHSTKAASAAGTMVAIVLADALLIHNLEGWGIVDSLYWSVLTC